MSEDKLLSLPLRPFFTASGTATVLVDSQGKITAANPAFLKLIKRSVAGVLDHPILNFFADEKKPELHEVFAAFSQKSLQRLEFETWITHADSEMVPIKVVLSQVNDLVGNPLCLMLSIVDKRDSSDEPPSLDSVTSLTIEELRSQVLDHLPHAILIINFANHIEDINKHGEVAFGYSKYELWNRPVNMLFPELRELLPPSSFLTSAVHEPLSVHALHKNGYKIPLSLELKPARFGRNLYWLAVAQNPKTENYINGIERSVYWRKLSEGIYNRIYFQEQLDRALHSAARREQKLGVLIVGLDRYEQLRDSLGSEVSNQLLKEAGKRILEFVRKNDSVIQYDPGQYAIFLEDIRHVEHISLVAQKLCNSFLAPLRSGVDEIYASVNIGISVFPMDGSESKTLITKAEHAMRQMSQEGGNSFLYYSPEFHTRALQRIQLENELRRAHRNGDFRVYYQPILNADSRRVTCLEALLRWDHPQRGLVSPSTFVPLLEETGLIDPVGEWVLHSACQFIRSLHDNGHTQLRVSVNISARQFAQQDFLSVLKRILAETHVDPKALELEITESVLIKNTEKNRETITAIAASGVKIVLDDFGTGCSSLSYLKQFPIHALKLDRDFVRGLPDQPWDIAITDAILVLATKLGLRVTAEGVETEMQLNYLRRKECHEMQGYFFARPMPTKEVSPWLEKRGSNS